MSALIILFFAYVAEALILWQYSEAIFLPRHSAKTRLLVLSGTHLATYLIGLPRNLAVNVIAFLLATYIFLSTQYRTKKSIAFLHAAILDAVMGFTELAVYAFLLPIVPHFLTDSSLYYVNILFVSFSKLLYFLALFFLAHIWGKQTPIYNQQNSSAILLGLIPLCSCFIVGAFMYLGESENFSPQGGMIISVTAVFLLGITFFVYGFYQYIQKKNAQLTDTKLLLQKEQDTEEYYRMLLQQHENQSILIHDIKKHLQSIEILQKQNEIEKANAYIRQLLLSSDLKEAANLCDNKLLNSILTRYQRQCSEKHISFHTDIREGTTEFMADNDLTSLFCNLLDNAVEAAEGIPGGYIEITSTKKEKSNLCVITVVNSCRTDPLCGQPDAPATRKPDKKHHGFGIKSIRRTVNKYHGDLQMYYNPDAMTFHAVLTLKMKTPT